MSSEIAWSKGNQQNGEVKEGKLSAKKGGGKGSRDRVEITSDTSNIQRLEGFGNRYKTKRLRLERFFLQYPSRGYNRQPTLRRVYLQRREIESNQEQGVALYSLFQGSQDFAICIYLEIILPEISILLGRYRRYSLIIPF